MSLKKTNTQVNCPTCSKKVVWGSESPWRPFCSERCRLIDLGDWLDENNRISEPVDEYPAHPPDKY